MEDFAVGRDYEAVLEHFDFNESHVVLFVAQHTIMHDDFRMKIDHDFFNGDDYLNDTEAMEFEMMFVMNWVPEGCDESGPNFTVSGLEVDCAEPSQMFHGLANDSEEEDIVWTAGWFLHYSNVTVDDNGELVVYYAGTTRVTSRRSSVDRFADLQESSRVWYLYPGPTTEAQSRATV